MTRQQRCAEMGHPGTTYISWSDTTWCACGWAVYPGVGPDAHKHLACCGGPLDIPVTPTAYDHHLTRSRRRGTVKKIDDEIEIVDPDYPRPSIKTGMIRCGFCVTGHHDKCCIAIPQGKDSTRHIWRCACNCAIGRTKCVNCNRRDVEVTGKSTCLDAEDCKVYRDTKRRQYMEELTGTTSPETPSYGQTPKPKPRASVAKVCLCCGEPTRGGKFLPGHDARYLSLQLKRYLEEDDKGAILEEVRRISESLLGKLQARIRKSQASERVLDDALRTERGES